MPGGHVLEEWVSPDEPFTEIRKRFWRKILKLNLFANVKCRIGGVTRPIQSDDLRFRAVLNRHNKVYEFLKRDEDNSIRKMEIFGVPFGNQTFWIRLDLASSSEEQIQNERMVENTVGKNHIEHLRRLTKKDKVKHQKRTSNPSLTDQSLIDAEVGLASYLRNAVSQENLSVDQKWQKDFGAARRTGITLIDTEQWREGSKLCRDLAKNQIRVRITGLPLESPLEPVLVSLEASVREVLEQIGRKLSEVYDVQNICEKDRVTVNLETDYLAIKNRIELLLPRSEKLKNFTFVQSHHLVPVDLRLIKLGCLKSLIDF